MKTTMFLIASFLNFLLDFFNHEYEFSTVKLYAENF